MLAGWITALTGQTAEAQRWAAIVDAASFDLVPADGTASFDSARAMLRAIMCPAGPEQAMTDASFARRPGAAVEPMARHGALLVRRGASAHRRPRPGARPVRRVRHPGSHSWATPIRFVRRASPSSHCWRWIAGNGRRPPSTWNGHSPPSMSIGCTTTSFASLAFAAAARLAVHRGDLKRGGPPAHAGDARPSVLHVCAAMSRRARTTATCQGVLGPGRPCRPLDTCCVRSTTSCSTGRLLASWSTRSSEFRRDRHIEHSSGERPARRPHRPAELRLLPYLQTHLTFREIGERLFVSRNTVSTEVASIYRKLGVSSRRDAVQHATADRSARR